MSRRKTEFDNHQVFKHLTAVKSVLEGVELPPEAGAIEVEEAARLAKVIAYLEGVFETIDPDLFPLKKLDEASPQLSACANEIIAYSSNRSTGHLQSANTHLDAALDSIRPFVPFASKGARAYARAVGEQTRAASAHIEGFSDSISDSLASAQSATKAIEDAEAKVNRLLGASEAAAAELSGSDGDTESGILAQAKSALADIEAIHEKINEFHGSIFLDGEKESKKAAIGSALSEAKKSAEEAKALVAGSSNAVSELKKFFDHVFGDLSENGERSGGVAAEIESLRAKLIEFQGDQEKRYKALNEQIESLLPGATSAGLASAYREMKNSFERPIRFFSTVFFLAIAVLVAGSLVLHIQSVSRAGITFIELASLEAVLKSFVYKLPFYGPAVWLAYFASKRRSESQRLQQEYAHKEALAKSYDSYKKQIEELGADDGDLMKRLLERAIEAVSYNASRTLDGAHGDPAPSQDLIGQIERIMRGRREPSSS